MSNRLADSNSPYLLQHADNPVDWYPWGPEAFKAAAEQGKPIFLSVGYAACHWCHVMEHESFEDPDTAKFMNEHFVNVKVDREQRPDVDSIYMDAVVALSGHGGWPMSVFLTPDGEPFFGGTYYPPQPRHGMPSFRQVLEHIRRIWLEQRDRAQAAGAELTERLAHPERLPSAGNWKEADLDRAAQNLHTSFDWRHGGWGDAPKFPQATAIDFLLRYSARRSDKLARDIAVRSLQQMASGGIYDQLGGGFARYSVDRKWLIPHFEKMLYDNALLIKAYVHAWQLTGQPELLETAQETIAFLAREMRHPQGGFYSSIDADSEGEEGKFYVWTLAEIHSVVPDETQRQLFTEAYGVTESGNFEGANVLFRSNSAAELAGAHGLPVAEVEALLADAEARLLEARGTRVRPATDDKVLAAWNGFTLSAFARHALATGNEGTLDMARGLAEFLLESLFVDGHLLRSWRAGKAEIDAFLEDHAALGLGFLDLYRVDFQPRWFVVARNLAQEILESFTDPDGGFFDTRAGSEELVRRPRSIQDSPTPSGSSMAIRLLQRIDALDQDRRASEAAERGLARLAGSAPDHPTAFAGWLIAADFALGPQHQLAISGDPQSEQFQQLLEAIRQRLIPGLEIAGGMPGVDNQPRLLEGRGQVEDLPTAYLCQNFSCQLPTNDPAVLRRQIEGAL